MLNINYQNLFIQIIQLLRYAIILCMFIFPLYACSGVSIESGFYQSNIELYYKSDLFSTKGSSNRIFWIQLNNDAASKEVAISIEIVNKNGGRVLSGRTKYFPLSASQNQFLSNIDLSYMRHPYGIESFEWFDESENLQRGLHNAGRLPSDEYIFVFGIIDKNGKVLKQTESQLTITNPIKIDLISPGRIDTDQPVQLFSKFPLFQWESPALRFELVVCEKLPENSGPEDALNNEPHLKIEVNATFYQYPFTSQSGVRALEEGHTYCWQLSAMVQTSSGQVKIKSEIGEFQIANPSLKPETKLSDEKKQIIITLTKLLSEFGLQKWLENFMNEYPDYKPTGDIIIDGKKISGAEFVKLLEKLRSEGFGILKIEVNPD